MTSPVNPGEVEWSGENPGIYLKDAAKRWWAASGRATSSGAR